MIEMFLAIAILFIASISDLKTREVPDWLSYATIAIGILFAFSNSIVQNSFFPLVNSGLGFIGALVIAALLFYLGQWGGGDSKLLVGLGVLLGADINSLFGFFSGNLNEPWYFGFFLNMILSGAIYGLCFSIYLGIKNYKKLEYELKIQMSNKQWIKPISFVLVLLGGICFAFPQTRILSALFATIGLGIWILIYTKAVELSSMFKLVTPDKLTEGDWIAKDVIFKGKKITGPSDLGIEKNKIEILKKLYNKNKIKKILIKEGIPFIPVFLISLVLTYFKGAIILRLIGI